MAAALDAKVSFRTKKVMPSSRAKARIFLRGFAFAVSFVRDLGEIKRKSIRGLLPSCLSIEPELLDVDLESSWLWRTKMR